MNGGEFREMTNEEKATVMDNKSAQTEANMLREVAHNGLDNDFSTGEKILTAEDYSVAEILLEDLIEGAEYESLPEKVRLFLIRTELRFDQLVNQFRLGISGNDPEKHKRIIGTIDAITADINTFKSYSTKLEELKERARAFESLPKDMNEGELEQEVLPSVISLPENLSEDKMDLLVDLLQKYHIKYDQIALVSDKKTQYKIQILGEIIADKFIDLPDYSKQIGIDARGASEQMLYAEAATEVRADVEAILSK